LKSLGGAVVVSSSSLQENKETDAIITIK
jgi:hypothetical protein